MLFKFGQLAAAILFFFLSLGCVEVTALFVTLCSYDVISSLKENNPLKHILVCVALKTSIFASDILSVQAF